MHDVKQSLVVWEPGVDVATYLEQSRLLGVLYTTGNILHLWWVPLRTPFERPVPDRNADQSFRIEGKAILSPMQS